MHNNRFKIKLHSILKETFVFPNYLFLALIVIILGLQIYLVSDLKNLPSPPYGGDLYRERAFTQHYLNGEPIYSDPYIEGEYAFYPNLSYILLAGLTFLTGWSLDKIIIYFPIFLTPLFCIVMYFLAKELTTDKQIAWAAALTYALFNLLNMKYSSNLGFLFILLFIIFYIKILKNEQSWITKEKILAGIFMGLASLSHYTSFFIVLCILSTSLFMESIYQLVIKKKGFWEVIKIKIKQHLIFCLIGLIVSLIFFYPIIFIYKFNTLNPTNIYAGQDTDTLGISWLFSVVTSFFINTSSIPSFFIGVLAIGGLILTIMNFNKIEMRLTIFLLVGAIAMTGHYLITKPLFNFSIVPGNLAVSIVLPVMLLFIIGLLFVKLLLKKTISNNVAITIFFIVLFLLLSAKTYTEFKNMNNDRWIIYGRSNDQSIKVINEMQDWILKNTDNNDVFLSNDESSFMITGISGRNVVFTRRVHASAYVDMEKRYADGVMMMYCKNTSLSKELLKKYNVTYFYIDGATYQSPIIVNISYVKDLEKCNISYIIQDVPLDPSIAMAKKFTSAVVPAQNLTIIELVDDSKIKTFFIENNVYSIIYPIKS